ncbi:MAG: hypothetical protein VKQ33_13160, partial [Candidatus Sericytochromatia bacterium]|nr:hypothetical protein [Candidatus Sericytochromatia bacterium]
MHHDRRHKRIVETFPGPFLQAFAPALAAAIAPGSLRSLNQELPGAAADQGDRRADVVLQATLAGEEAWLVVHIELQARSDATLPVRMYDYATRLEVRHGRPVYPIALLTYDRPRVPAPDTYVRVLAGREVVRFRYHVVQLSRLCWQDHCGLGNPAAAALMARMNVAPADRARVQWEGLRQGLALGLSEPELRTLMDYLDAYVPLDEAQRAEFKALIRKEDPAMEEP